MPFKTEHLEEPGLNLTPMVDVVMLLMIFFMVGTQFIRRESQYEIQLPKVSDAQPLTALPDELVVYVSEDGTIHLGNEERTLQQLEDDLRAAKERYSEQVVVIRGDADGPYQHVMSVLNACRRAQISVIQLANRINDQSGA